MNRRLTTRPGMGGIVGARTRRPRACAAPRAASAAATARPLRCPGDRTAAPAPGERPQRAPRRGVAVLHQVGVDDRLPVGARPRPAARARREQAAAADGPPDRVLHPDRRARPRPVRGRRRDAARRRDRARPAARHRASSSTHAGRPSSPRRSTRCAPSTTAPGRGSRTSARTTRAALRTFDPAGIELRLGDARTLLPTLAPDSVDFVATDPPYNVQLPMTMAGGTLAMTHANRRTDYAMRSDLPADLANLPDYAGLPRRDERDPRRAPPGAPARALRRADRPRRLPGGAIPVHRRGPRRARRGRGPRAQGRRHLVPGRDPATAVRLPARVRAQHRAPAHRRAAEGSRAQAAATARKPAATPADPTAG